MYLAITHHLDLEIVNKTLKDENGDPKLDENGNVTVSIEKFRT